jgi:hypothetical protein
VSRSTSSLCSTTPTTSSTTVAASSTTSAAECASLRHGIRVEEKGRVLAILKLAVTCSSDLQ